MGVGVGVGVVRVFFHVSGRTKSCAEALVLVKQMSFLPSMISVRNLLIETTCELMVEL